GANPSYTPQHNPFSEREAVSTATFLCNLIPKHENQVTPYEIWYKTKPPLHKLKTFGCQAWLKIPTKNISDKFGPKAWDGIFLGYENEASSYRILRLSDQKIIISKHVLFNEKKFPSLQFQKQITEEIFKTFPNSTSITTEEPTNESNSEENSSNTESVPEENEEVDIFVDALEQQPQRIRVIGPRHPTLISREIDRDNILPFPRRQPRTNSTNLINHTPKNYNEAMISPNKEDWNLAIQKELLNINKLNVWTLRNKKESDHPITSTWVFKEKTNDSGEIIEYKARLCAHGFHQIAGLDYQSTFAPTGRLASLHTLISFAAIHK
ncbi:hypothetical protein O181_112134, partial [Austropuccinia psidii MF-1]|nr:hypothetical protein [Austropuccinia psidii MF-1]